jgi:hypothetical protein
MNSRYISIAVVLIVFGLAVFHGHVAFVANSRAGLRNQLLQASFMLIPLGILFICALFFREIQFRPDQFFLLTLALLVIGSFWEYSAGFNFGGAIVGFFNFMLACLLAIRAIKSLRM